jgi:thioredoxin reductase
LPNLREEYDVVVVGAGPAGMAAASLCARSRLLTLLLDEQAGPGGRMYHAITATPLADRAILGRDYWIGEKIANELEASGAEYVRGATVTQLAPHFELAFTAGGTASAVKAMRVILAVGAVERAVDFEGAGLGGVALLGRAQMQLQAAGAVPRGRVVIAGTGPFLWRAADRLLNAGATIGTILDTTPLANHVRALRHFPGYLVSPHFRELRAMRRAVGRRAAVQTGVTQLRAEGEGILARVGYRDRAGAAQTLPADSLLVHRGFIPNVALAKAAGLEHRWSEKHLCWVPLVRGEGATAVPGLFITGNAVGVAGGQAAAWRGVLTAGAVIAEVRPDLARASGKIAREALARFLRGRRYLDTLYQPEASVADEKGTS